VTNGVLVEIGTVASLNITLHPGAATELVTVTSEGPTIESNRRTSAVSSTQNRSSIFPSPWAALAPCAPMRHSSSCSRQQRGPERPTATTGIFLSKIAGGQNYGNEVLIDGVSQQRSENGSSLTRKDPPLKLSRSSR